MNNGRSHIHIMISHGHTRSIHSEGMIFNHKVVYIKGDFTRATPATLLVRDIDHVSYEERVLPMIYFPQSSSASIVDSMGQPLYIHPI
jgi:hypothetical protein